MARNVVLYVVGRAAVPCPGSSLGYTSPTGKQLHDIIRASVAEVLQPGQEEQEKHKVLRWRRGQLRVAGLVSIQVCGGIAYESGFPEKETPRIRIIINLIHMGYFLLGIYEGVMCHSILNCVDRHMHVHQLSSFGRPHHTKALQNQCNLIRRHGRATALQTAEAGTQADIQHASRILKDQRGTDKKACRQHARSGQSSPLPPGASSWRAWLRTYVHERTTAGLHKYRVLAQLYYTLADVPQHAFCISCTRPASVRPAQNFFMPAWLVASRSDCEEVPRVGNT